MIKRTNRKPWSLAGAALAAAVLGGLPAGGGVEEARAADRPNVVVIMTDDQDAKSVRVMRGVRQQLGGRGTTFTNAFATFPLCCPSRVTFLTGQYAHNHGVLDNHPPNGGYQAFKDSGTLPVSLNRAGYRTAWFGKYLNGYSAANVDTPAERNDIPPGWDRWYAALGNAYFGGSFNDNGRFRKLSRSIYQTDHLANKAVNFIRESAHRANPFFLTLAVKAPHAENGPNPKPAPRHRGDLRGIGLPTPPSFNEQDVSDKPAFVPRERLGLADQRMLRSRHQARLETLLGVDEAVKRIIAGLRRAGELRNTLVVFTSDNGLLNGEHRLISKTYLYEESAKVPLLMRGPGIPRGKERSQLVGNIDIAPTILDTAGAEPLRVMDGRSLLPLAQSPQVGRNRDLLFENQQSTAVRTQRYMYAEHPNDEFELYDLRSDPFQLRSRHDDPSLAGVRATLAQRLAELEDCAGQSCR